MNITFVAIRSNKTGGGSNISLDAMCRGLINKGHGVKVLTTRPAQNDPFPGREYEVLEIASRRLPYDIDLLGPLETHLDQLSGWTDVFHVFNPYLAPLVGRLIPKYDAGFVLRFNTLSSVCTRGTPFDDECYRQCGTVTRFAHDTSRLARRVLKLPEYRFQDRHLWTFVNRFDRIFAVSPAVRRVISSMGADDHRIAMIPNFLDGKLTRDRKVKSSYDLDGDRQLLYVGRLETTKNLFDPIRAIGLLPDNYKLQIIGDGSLEREIRRTMTNMSVANRVTLHGYVDNDRLTPFYEEADVFIHPMRGPYTFSRTCLEAISANLPIICTTTGDTHQMLPNSSVTYSEGDPGDLARTIEDLFGNRHKLSHLSEGIVEDVNQYTRDETIRKIEDEYDAVTAQ